jgi:hypothetical protein
MVSEQSAKLPDPIRMPAARGSAALLGDSVSSDDG